VVLVPDGAAAAEPDEPYIEVLQGEIARARAKHIVVRAKVGFLDEALDGEDHELVWCLFDDILLDENQHQLVAAGSECLALDLRYGEQHPSAVAARSRLEQLTTTQREQRELLLAELSSEAMIADVLVQRLADELTSRGAGEDADGFRAVLMAEEAGLKVRSLELAVRRERCEGLVGAGDHGQAALLLDHPGTAAYSSLLSEARAEDAELSIRYGEKHPTRVHQLKRIESLRINHERVVDLAIRCQKLHEDLIAEQIAALRAVQPD